MGYSVCRFVGSVDENLLCSICSAVLQDPVLTPCGHSFCAFCLDTWLARPNHAKSCPHCRTATQHSDAHPILSIRSLVNSLAIHCDNREHGCEAVVTLDAMDSHRIRDCSYEQLQCAGCHISLNRCELRSHHNACDIIQKILARERNSISDKFESEENAGNKEGAYNTACLPTVDPPVATVRELIARVTVLESHLQHVRQELDMADCRNKRMERDLKRTRVQLEDKRAQLTDHIFVDFDPNYDYGFTQSSIKQLSCFLARFLSSKPDYVDQTKLFTATKRCYENFGHSGEVAENEVLLLLTTAYASNWFTRSQRVSINCWLQSLMKYKTFADIPEQIAGLSLST